MKNKLIAVAFMLLMNHVLHSQNYLTDGGFEQASNCVNTSLLWSPCVSTSYALQPLERTYFNALPGGESAVKLKMAYWTDRDVTDCLDDGSGGCIFQSPHSPDWLWPGNTNGSPVIARSGNGCIGSTEYEMFQQNLTSNGVPIVRNGTYKMSAFIYQALTGSDPAHNIHFLFSGSQPDYKDDAAQAIPAEPSCDYTTVKGLSNIQYIPIIPTTPLNYYMANSGDIDMGFVADHTYANSNWTFMETSFTLSNNPNYNWFSVEIDENTNDGTGTCEFDDTYFAFDNVYVDQAQCYCPIIEDVENQTLAPGSLVRAQDEVIIGNNVSLASGGSTLAVFRAGQSITINPGFQAQYGSLFTTQIANCYDGQGAITATIPGTFDPCDPLPQNTGFPIISTNATSYYLVWADRWGTTASYTGDIDASVPNVHTIIPVAVSYSGLGAENYVYHLTLYGCNGTSLYLTGNETVDDPNCGPSFKTNPPVGSLVDTIPIEISSFEVYPSPACDNLKISISNYSPSDLIQILDLTGQDVRQFNPTGSDNSYDISGLSDGVYTVKYISTNNSQTRKIVKVCK